MKSIKYLIFTLLVAICSPLALFAKLGSDQSLTAEELPIADLERFATVIQHIKNYYVTNVDDTTLIENAIRGMLQGLDPHSVYFDQEEFTKLKDSTRGKFGGLGVEIVMEDGLIKVISPLEGTPAEKAGIQTGDFIVKINNTSVKGLNMYEAVELMHGKPSTELQLTIVRDGAIKPIVMKVSRAVINVQSVRSNLLEPHFGYIRISQFQNDTGKEVIKSIKNLEAQNKQAIKGLILDLRNNPGGVVDSGVEVANAFLDSDRLKLEPIVFYTKGRAPGAQIKEKVSPGDLINNAPIIVLVNGGSASTAEIVAGALQDHQRALIVGSKTFGKGSVQLVLPLKDKRGLKLTTSLYYTPAGHSIQAKGIIPDIVIDKIKVSSSGEDDKALELREQDLKGHLGSTSDPKKLDVNNDKMLINSDYQLHEALLLLKALSISTKA